MIEIIKIIPLLEDNNYGIEFKIDGMRGIHCVESNNLIEQDALDILNPIKDQLLKEVENNYYEWYDKPLATPGIYVCSPDIKEDPDEAIDEAQKELNKKFKSIALMAMSNTKYNYTKKEKEKEKKQNIKDLTKVKKVKDMTEDERIKLLEDLLYYLSE